MNPTKEVKTKSSDELSAIRIQKLISQAGICSRRKAETLIRRGKVTVNGHLIEELGFKADPNRDDIRVEGKKLSSKGRQQVWAMCKPRGVICTKTDDEGRPTVYDLIPKKFRKLNLMSVGRLEFQAQGLLLFTNDGELLNRLTHPRFKIPKRYDIKIRGKLTPGEQRKFSKGVYLREEGMRSKPIDVKIKQTLGSSSWIQIELTESKNHLIRRMCEALGHQVSKLNRVSVGPISLGKLPEGRMRELNHEEIDKLYRAAGL